MQTRCRFNADFSWITHSYNHTSQFIITSMTNLNFKFILLESKCGQDESLEAKTKIDTLQTLSKELDNCNNESEEISAQISEVTNTKINEKVDVASLEHKTDNKDTFSQVSDNDSIRTVLEIKKSSDPAEATYIKAELTSTTKDEVMARLEDDFNIDLNSRSELELEIDKETSTQTNIDPNINTEKKDLMSDG